MFIDSKMADFSFLCLAVLLMSQIHNHFKAVISLKLGTVLKETITKYTLVHINNVVVG